MKKYVQIGFIDADELPGNMFSLIKFLHDKLLEVPEEYRSDAEIVFEAKDDYGQASLEIDLYYQREENEEEKEERSRKSMRAFELEVDTELELLAKLKAKYE